MGLKRLIYISGIHKRSGTNFLTKLLLQHPQIKYCKHPGEDFLLVASSLLVQYVNDVSKMWSEEWKGMCIPDYKMKLHGVISKALNDYLGVSAENYTLTKTPSTVGLDNFFKLFPGANLIILVRDGRNVVESGVQSFGWKYQQGFRRWTESALRIQKFLEQNKAFQKQYMLVKYEDLNNDTENVLRNIFDHFGINQLVYPFSEVKSVPVVGSSTSSEIFGKIDWSKQIEKTNEFRPNDRYLHWDFKTKLSYNKICGEMAIKLGYEVFDRPQGFLKRFFSFK
jgi:hypothetical protein